MAEHIQAPAGGSVVSLTTNRLEYWTALPQVTAKEAAYLLINVDPDRVAFTEIWGDTDAQSDHCDIYRFIKRSIKVGAIGSRFNLKGVFLFLRKGPIAAKMKIKELSGNSNPRNYRVLYKKYKNLYEKSSRDADAPEDDNKKIENTRDIMIYYMAVSRYEYIGKQDKNLDFICKEIESKMHADITSQTMQKALLRVKDRLSKKGYVLDFNKISEKNKNKY